MDYLNLLMHKMESCEQVLKERELLPIETFDNVEWRGPGSVVLFWNPNKESH